MSWITDRLPTADDANKQGYVLVCSLGDMVSAWHWRNVIHSPWKPLYDPPPTREELVQELLDAIDDESDYDMWQVAWRLKVIKAREKLK